MTSVHISKPKGYTVGAFLAVGLGWSEQSPHKCIWGPHIAGWRLGCEERGLGLEVGMAGPNCITALRLIVDS